MLWRNGKRVRLTRRALNVLTVLVQRRDRVVSKDEILDLAFPGVFVEPGNIAVHISEIRKVLGRGTITTFPGIGYQFSAELDGSPRPVPTSAAINNPARKRQTNLPIALTALVGREAELVELGTIFQRVRLVTVTGPGGVGKTRLATEFGQQVLAKYDSGVWLIDLAPVDGADFIISAAATVLGVVLHAGQAPLDLVAAAISQKNLLLIFDNCEHLAAPVARVLAGLLSRVPGLSVLATSQEMLSMAGEHVYRLDPLSVPPELLRKIDHDADEIAKIARFGAVEFFVARARSTDRRFRLGPENVASVVAICRALDGIPLTLEMAAARLRMFGIDGLRARLDDQLDLLGMQRRLAAVRYRTLRSMVEWSVGLLDGADQLVFRRLAVFPGSFSLDAAIAIAGSDQDTEFNTIDALGRLVDKSLVCVEDNVTPRYRLLEALRLVGLEQLSTSGERPDISERHASFFSSLLDVEHKNQINIDPANWFSKGKGEIVNIREAMKWTLEKLDKSELFIMITKYMIYVCRALGLMKEAQFCADVAWSNIDDTMQDTADLERLVADTFTISGTVWFGSSRNRAVDFWERAIGLYRRCADKQRLGSSLSGLGAAYIGLGRYQLAEAVLRESYALLSKTQHHRIFINTMLNLSILAIYQREFEEARSLSIEGISLAISKNQETLRYLLISNLAEIHYHEGDVGGAIALQTQVISYFRENDISYRLVVPLLNLVNYLLAQSRLPEARQHAAEALIVANQQGGYVVRIALQQWALIGAFEGKYSDAARLVGFVNAGFVTSEEVRDPGEQQSLSKAMALIEAHVQPIELDRYLSEGADMKEAEAVDIVTHSLDVGHLPIHRLE